MIDPTRRALVLASLSSILVSKLSSASPNDTPLSLFINESGVINNPLERRPFVCGVLSCIDVDSLEKALHEKREKLGYLLEVSYTSTNRYKEDFAKHIIDTVLDSNAVKLKVAVLPPGENIGWPKDKAEEASVYAEHQRQRMENPILSSRSSVKIKLERRTRGARDFVLRDHLIYSHGNKIDIEFIESQESILFQACDLITGSVFGALDGRVTNKLKNDLIEYLLSKLGVDKDALNSRVKTGNFELVYVEKT